VTVVGATSSRGSPVQKVIQLLGSLQEKIKADGDAEGRQYDKFVEWCETNAKDLQHELDNAASDIEELEAAIEEADSGIEQAESRISELSDSIAEDEDELKKATDVRNSEHKDWAAVDKSLAETISTLERAAGLIKKQIQGSLLQLDQDAMQKVVVSLSALVDASIFSTKDTTRLNAFLQAQQNDQEAPEGMKTILSVLEDMLAKAEGQRADAQKAETEAKYNFEMVKSSLEQRGKQQQSELADSKKELSAQREAKATATGELEVSKKDQAADAQSLRTLQSDCMQTASDHEASVAERNEELKALAKAKQVIEEKTGGADARGSFLLQVKATTKMVEDDSDDTTGLVSVVENLRRLGRQQKSMQLSLLASKASAVAAHGAGKDVFAKVKKLIEGMIGKLLDEARKEGAEKAFCDKEMKETEEKKGEHEEDLESLQGKIDKAEASIIKLTEEIATLEKELGELATSQKEMDQNRQEEHAEYEKAAKDYSQGVDGVQMAIKVLKDYYGQSFLQQPSVSSHSASEGGASGIIGLLEVAESDFSKLLAETEADERAAQADYEAQTKANEISKAEKKTSLKYKRKAQAETEKVLEDLKSDRDSEQSELDAVLDYYSGIKKRCVAQPEPYEERKRRREKEIEGLKDALETLENESAGAFLAVKRHTRRVQ